jgi:hypothetical protein
MLDLSSLVSFFVLGVIGWVTYKVYIWPFYISPLRKIPGPPSDNLLYGNVKSFFTEGVSIVLYFNLIDLVPDSILYIFFL